MADQYFCASCQRWHRGAPAHRSPSGRPACSTCREKALKHQRPSAEVIHRPVNGGALTVEHEKRSRDRAVRKRYRNGWTPAQA